MSNKLRVIRKKPDKKECHHYWVIESPGGPTSRGVCKLCGAKKEFSNRFLDLRQRADT